MLVWLLALVPLVLLAVLVALIVGLGPAQLIQGSSVPPVERLAITRVDLSPSRIELSVLNERLRVRGGNDVQLLTAADVAALKPLVVVRTPAEAEAWGWIEAKIHAALDPDRGGVQIA